MSKTIAFRLIIGLSLLIAATIWLLSFIPATAQLFTIGAGTVGHWVVFALTLGWGIAFIVRGVAVKSNGPPFIRRLWVIFGVLLLVVAAIIIVEVFAWFEEGSIPIIPIVAVGLALALFVSLIAVGGRKWDQADNEMVNSQPARPKTQWELRQEQNARDDAARNRNNNSSNDGF